MRIRITLDEFPQYSPWPARLLGSEPLILRTAKHIKREFEEKYGRLADDPSLYILNDVRNAEMNPRHEVVMSLRDDLFVTDNRAALEMSMNRLRGRIWTTARAHGARSIVDLGCGYGYMLPHLRGISPGVGLSGGDLSPSAIRLAQKVHHRGIQVDYFDFLWTDYLPVRDAAAPVLVVTSFALHQLPSAGPVIERLSRYREKIAAVVCMEPEEDVFGDSLLGLMRKRYGEINGYSADLVRCLRARDDVVIDETHANVIGSNALLPGTLTVWRFRT